MTSTVYTVQPYKNPSSSLCTVSINKEQTSGGTVRLEISLKRAAFNMIVEYCNLDKKLTLRNTTVYTVNGVTSFDEFKTVDVAHAYDVSVHLRGEHPITTFPYQESIYACEHSYVTVWLDHHTFITIGPYDEGFQICINDC